MPQDFGTVISERAPDMKDLVASQELEKFLRAMGLYEDETGSRRRKVGAPTRLIVVWVVLNPRIPFMVADGDTSSWPGWWKSCSIELEVAI